MVECGRVGLLTTCGSLSVVLIGCRMLIHSGNTSYSTNECGKDGLDGQSLPPSVKGTRRRLRDVSTPSLPLSAVTRAYLHKLLGIVSCATACLLLRPPLIATKPTKLTPWSLQIGLDYPRSALCMMDTYRFARYASVFRPWTALPMASLALTLQCASHLFTRIFTSRGKVILRPGLGQLVPPPLEYHPLRPSTMCPIPPTYRPNPCLVMHLA